MSTGPSHPAFKHGRFSKHFPTKLAARIQESYDDPDLLSAKRDVAILDARILAIAERFDAGGSGELWAKLFEQWQRLDAANGAGAAARDAGDKESAARAAEKFAAALSTIGGLIKSGHQEETVWHEVVDAIRDKVGVANIEHKRQQDLSQYLPASQAAMFVGALQQAVTETVVVGQVVDRAMLGRLGHRISELLHGRQGTQATTEGDGVDPQTFGGGGDVIDALPAPVDTNASLND